MNDEAPPKGGLDGNGAPRGGPAGVVERRTAFVAMVTDATTGVRPFTIAPERPMRRSISAPTIAACWSRARPRNGFRVVDAFSRIIRLGEGIAASGRISDAGDGACGRGAHGLPRQDARARSHARAAHCHRGLPCRRERAKRSAPASREEAGLELEIVDPRPRRGSRRPAARSCSIPRRPASSCSTSAAARRNWCGSGRAGAGRRGPPEPDIVGWASLPVGVVTLAERYGGTWCRAEIYEAMVDEVPPLVEKFADGAPLRPRRLPHARHLGHGDDHRRRSSQAARATTAAGSTAAGFARRGVARGRRAHRDELRRARRQSVHRRRARRPGARRLRHPRRASAAPFRARGCASPTAACARACWSR